MSSTRFDVVFYVPTVGELLGRSAPSRAGGAETQILLVARGLSERGLRVGLWAYDMPGGLPAAVAGVVVLRRRSFLGGRGLLGALREAWATMSAVARVRSTVVVTRIAGPHVGLVGFVARLMRRRFVYSSANLPDFAFASRDVSLRDRALHRVGLRLAQMLVAQTRDQAELCRRNIRRDPVVIPNIVERAPERSMPGEYFLWVGRAVSSKRPLELIALANALPTLRFVMVVVPNFGPGDLSGAIASTAADVPNLELMPTRRQSELGDLIDGAVAIVNTSEFEGMPNVSLEGWARGVPTLALGYDPDDVIKEHGLGEHAAGSFERLVDAARRTWEARGGADAVEASARCRRYVTEQHGYTAVIDAWLAALELTPVADGASIRTVEAL